jgi:hypothetical protein
VESREKGNPVDTQFQELSLKNNEYREVIANKQAKLTA